jgi:MFS family permease
MEEKRNVSAVTKWMTLIIVALAGGLITKLPYLRETYMDPLQQATGATKTQLGMIMSAYGIVNFICYFPGGILADKFSSKKLIMVSCFGTALAGLWYWTMPGFVWLVVIHGIFAITTVFTFWAAMVKSINNLGEPEEQGRLFGMLEGGRGLIGTIAAFGSVAVFGLAADDIGGMKNAILYYSILLIVAGVLAGIFMRDDKPVQVAEKAQNPLNMKDFMAVAKMPTVWLCGALGICNYSALIFHGYVTAYLSGVRTERYRCCKLKRYPYLFHDDGRRVCGRYHFR